MANRSAAVSDVNLERSRPPGPRGLPFLGNIADFGRDQLGFVQRCRTDHGEIVSANFAGWPTLLVTDMDAIESILVKNHHSFTKNSLVWRQTRALFGDGLLTSEGELWQRQRRLAAPAFAGKQLAGYAPAIVAAADNTVGHWTDGDCFDMHPRMMGLSLRIAARTLFDSGVDDEIAIVDRALNDLLREMESRIKRPVLLPDALPLPGHIRYRRAIRDVEALVQRMIAERRDTGAEGRTDFLSRLMAARDAEGNRMSDALLRDEAVTLLLAGHETTALVLSWAFYLLGQNMAAADRIAEEAESVAPGRPLDADDVDHLKWTEAVITETMRVFPPSWIIGRESIRPFEIGGYAFPAGVTIFISQWVIHRDHRYYPRPEEFMPERWLGDFRHSLPRFAYMPFGGGPRICIGQRFAIIEAVLILATILRRFRIEWTGDRPIVPQPSITLRPRGGVHVRVTRRH
ncbi:cytochrome P450 [Shinella sp.]|uniref:cytochrome P450 n=1 Tax=Shinella sp. TaxID=1870904 RepID=UPI002587EA13|nr:cytochrome P450 [Shinella sp.]MCW5710714.1 cytochrome P450 [Shinella sp.]